MVLDVNFGLENVVSYFDGNNVSKLYADSYWLLRSLYQATENVADGIRMPVSEHIEGRGRWQAGRFNKSIEQMINDVQRYEKFLKDIDRRLAPKGTLYLYELILLREFRQSLDEVSEYLLKKALPHSQFRDSKDFFSEETTEQMQGYLKELHNGDRAKKFEVDERFLGILGRFYDTARNLGAFYGQKKVKPILEDRQAMLWRHSLFDYMNEKFSRHYKIGYAGNSIDFSLPNAANDQT